MRRRTAISRRKNERGVIITLVAMFMLFVVGAMAALAIDVVSLYTARSEAQLAADSAALTAARVLANSGMTSSTDPLLASNAQTLASTIATQVAETNQVGGTNLTAAQINVTFPTSSQQNPHVTVQITSNIPTFFSRIWGRTQLQVKASATAEAYNSSGLALGALGGPAPPPAPTCVKPWVLPNIDPTGNQMFTTATGAINNSALVGWTDPNPYPNYMFHRLRPTQTPIAWQYYEGDQTSFPAPTSALPTCGFGAPDPYQTSIVGCVQVPITCGSTVNLNQTPDTNFRSAEAVNCLTHSTAGVAGDGDSIYQNPYGGTDEPFQFLGGTNNPVAGAIDNQILVSDSLVTVPVYDNAGVSGAPGTTPVTIIGFVQLFLNSDGTGTLTTGPSAGHIKTTIVNMVGCGTSASGPPYVYGNGPSAVPVRLITPP